MTVKRVGFGFVVATLAILWTVGMMVEAENCDPEALSPCLEALKDPQAKPSGDCCSEVDQQQPCLCKYLKNPEFAKLFNVTDAKRVAAGCNVPFPDC